MVGALTAQKYEALRLYGPVTMLPKYTEGSSQQLTIDSKNYLIPPRTYVIINVAGVHTNPSYWGPDALEFRPDRFITSSGMPLGEEELLQPPSGNFIPWAAGQRVCPGKKFAQVEFVAVIAKLFMKHRVSPVLQSGETMEMASERVKKCVLVSGIEVVLKMKHPERVQLVWEEKA
jgi:cytochrome P450